MLNNLKARLAVVVLLLVALALAGCFGPKSFTVTVKIDPALEGVEIREGSRTGPLRRTTNAEGLVEIKGVKVRCLSRKKRATPSIL